MIQQIIMLLFYDQAPPLYKQIEGCYSDTTTAILDPHSNTIQVQLVSSNNNNCTVLKGGVSANLTLSNPLFPNALTSSIDNFDYNKTLLLQFDIPIALSTNNFDEVFAIIHIFTLSEYTEIEILRFEIMRAELSECFQKISVYLTRYSFTVEAIPISHCKNVFILETPGQHHYISSIQIQINNFNYFLVHDRFIFDYQQQIPILQTVYSTTVNNIEKQLLEIIQSPLLIGQLLLTLNQDGRETAFGYPIPEFKISATFNLFKDGTIQINEKYNLVILRYDFNQIEPFQQRLQDANITHYQFRISGKYKKETIIRTETFKMPFDATKSIWNISCATGSHLQQSQCKNFFKQDQNSLTTNQATYYFDLLTFSDDTFIELQPVKLTSTYSCWHSSEVMVNQSHACIDLKENNKCNFSQLSSKTEYSAQVINVQTLSSGRSQMFYFQSYQNPMCFKCAEYNLTCKALLKKGVNHDIKLIYYINDNPNFYATTVTHFINDDYSIAKFVPMTIGPFFVLLFIILMIHQIYQKRRQIKQMKAEKHNH